MAVIDKPKYTHKNDHHGRESRLVIEPHNVEVGAFQHRGDKTWQAFGNFGGDGMNVPGFETEEEALRTAERWLADRLDKITHILRESVDRRLAAQS